MKKRWESKNILFLIILSELGISALATVMVFLRHIKVLPANKEWKFVSYTTFDEAYSNWLYIFFGFSVLTLFYLISKFFRKESISKENYLVCPSCEDAQAVNQNTKDVVCKKCGVKLVPLKGFYEHKEETEDQSPKE